MVSMSGLLTVVIVALVSCSAAGPDVPTSIGADVRCSDAIETLDAIPPGFVSSTGGLLALPDVSVNQLGRQGTDTDPDSLRRFAKIALIASNHADFVLFVANDSQGDALIAWGEGQSVAPGFGINVGPCSEAAGAWSVYPGGIWTITPRCVTLIVLPAGGNPLELRVPVGAACA